MPYHWAMGVRADTPRLSVTFAGHATVLLELDGVRLLTDPLLRKRIGVLIRRSPVPPASLRHDLGAVLISHAHLDHLDVPSLRLIDRRTPVVVPRGAGALLRRLGFVPLEMEVGDEVEIAAAPASRRREHGARRSCAPCRPTTPAPGTRSSGSRPPWATSSRAGSAPTSPATPVSTTRCAIWGRLTSRCCLWAAGARACPATTSTRCRRPRRSSCCVRRPASPCTGAPSTRRGCRRRSTPSGASGRTRSPATPRTSPLRSTSASCSRARRRCSPRPQSGEEAAGQ